MVGAAVQQVIVRGVGYGGTLCQGYGFEYEKKLDGAAGFSNWESAALDSWIKCLRECRDRRLDLLKFKVNH